MIPKIEVFIIENGEAARHVFELPNVHVSEFSHKKNWDVAFEWSDTPMDYAGDPPKNMIKIWSTVMLSDEEREILKAEGKMGLTSPQTINP